LHLLQRPTLNSRDIADYSLYEVSAEFLSYVETGSLDSLNQDSLAYVDNLATRISNCKLHHDGRAIFVVWAVSLKLWWLSIGLNDEQFPNATKASIPERYYREYSNPTLQCIVVVTLEAMACPLAPYILINNVLQLISTRICPASVLQAMALMISYCPLEEFSGPVFTHFINLLLTDALLLQSSNLGLQVS
jgi:hypothetical protein